MTRNMALGFVAWCVFVAAGSAADEGEEVKAIKALEKLGGLVWPVDTKAAKRNGMVIFGYKGFVSETDLKEAVVHLRKLPDLRVLSLNFTWVTDAGLAPLKELPELQVLSLKATRLTDAGLTHLQRIPGLRHIDLTLTRVTDKGVAALKKAMPKAKVLYSGTGKPAGEAEKLRGTWRGTRILPDSQKEYEQKDDQSLVVAGNDLAMGFMAFHFTLKPDSKPKRIDVEWTDCLPGLNTPYGNFLGIYRLEGDTLTICLTATYGDGKRPTKFSPERGTGFMYIFKRVKEAASDPSAPTESANGQGTKPLPQKATRPKVIVQPKESIPGPDREPDCIFMPSPPKVVDAMLKLANVQPGEVVFDLGSGDGRICIAAAKKYQARAFGYEIQADLVKSSLENVKKNKVEHLVTIERRDMFKLDLSGADVVTLWLLPVLNAKLIPQLEKMKPGSRIVSHDFDMLDIIKPEKVIEVEAANDDGSDKRSRKIYLWKTPLKKDEKRFRELLPSLADIGK